VIQQGNHSIDGVFTRRRPEPDSARVTGYSPRARSPVPIAIGAVLARPGKAVAATAPYVTGVTDWPENPIQYGRAG